MKRETATVQAPLGVVGDFIKFKSSKAGSAYWRLDRELSPGVFEASHAAGSRAVRRAAGIKFKKARLIG